MGPPAYDGTKHAAGTHGLRWGPNNVVSSGCRDGSVALWDSRARHWTKRHAYTALSRARAWEALSIED